MQVLFAVEASELESIEALLRKTLQECSRKASAGLPSFEAAELVDPDVCVYATAAPAHVPMSHYQYGAVLTVTQFRAAESRAAELAAGRHICETQSAGAPRLRAAILVQSKSLSDADIARWRGENGGNYLAVVLQRAGRPEGLNIASKRKLETSAAFITSHTSGKDVAPVHLVRALLAARLPAHHRSAC